MVQFFRKNALDGEIKPQKAIYNVICFSVPVFFLDSFFVSNRRCIFFLCSSSKPLCLALNFLQIKNNTFII